MAKKITLSELKNIIKQEAQKLMEAEQTQSYTFKVKHDNGSKKITTTASSLEAARKKIADAEGAPESALTLVS